MHYLIPLLMAMGTLRSFLTIEVLGEIELLPDLVRLLSGCGFNGSCSSPQVNLQWFCSIGFIVF